MSAQVGRLTYVFHCAAEDYDHKMIFGPSGLVIYDMVLALYLAGEDVVLDISGSRDVFRSEQYGWLAAFLLYFAHFFPFDLQI